MAWQIKLERRAHKALLKLDRATARRIITTLERKIQDSNDPRSFGSPLVGEWSGFWRYRIGDWRIIAKIEDDIVTIFIIRIAHRREAYR